MFDVTIIGLGPVGCTATILLAEAGLKVAVIERDEAVYRLPRAVNLDGEIIRAFQRVGRAEAVDALMQTVRPGDRAGFANADREWLFGQEMVTFGSNGWQPNNMFDQPEFEHYLRDQALEHPNVTSFVGREATAFDSCEGSTRTSLVGGSSGESSDVEARYLIACDGASSFVRKTLGIQSTNLGYDADWLVVDVIVNDTHTLSNDTVQVCDPDRIATYVCTKDPFRRWEFKLLAGETREEMEDPAKVMSLIDPWTPRGSYEIRRTAVYQFHASIANEWRRDNIFIAGDAAHQTPPFLGQGMNAGMRDVVNLSWKLPLVIRGVASDVLLDSYQAERFDHAHDLIDWAVSIGRLMDHMTERFRSEREGREPPPDAKLKSSAYGQGRTQPPISRGILCRHQVGEDGSTGHLFRQPLVRTSDGRELRLDELLGPGFAVVGVDDSALEISSETRATLDALDARVVSLEGLEPVKGRFDSLFEDADAAVVRPDRVVFGHTTAGVNIDDLVSALAEQLQVTTRKTNTGEQS